MSRRALAAWLVSAPALLLSCAPAPPEGLVLVSIDTLRPDRLGCYGASAPVSPAIDAFSRDGVLFRNARAHAPSTLLSHAALFSSRVPQRHGASHLRSIPLPADAVTLAERLRASGFRTSAVHGGGQLAPELGLDRGFETYEEEAGAFRATVARGLARLAALRPEERYFLFLHSYEVHHPYEPDPDLLAAVEVPVYQGELPDQISIRLLERINAGRRPVDAEDLRHIRAAYDAEIRSMDRGFDELLSGLERQGRLERALVVLVSDHGEEFGEHGRVGWHSHTLYDELLRVPLIVRVPGGPRGGEVAAPFRLIDLAPTLLQLLGLPAAPSFDGDARAELLRGAVPRASPPLVALGEIAGHRFEGILFGRYKLIEGRLYDLAVDPGETEDLAEREPDRVRELARLLSALTPALDPGVAVPRTDETRRALRALGYL